MEFGWINVFGAAAVVLMMIPNVVYAFKNKNEKNLCKNKAMNVIEQIGRYSCIVLMWLPLFVWKFGFSSVELMAAYLIGNGALISSYIVVFALYIKKKSARRAMFLAVAPACIFLLSGITLNHPLLFGAALIFAVSHIYVTKKNIDGKNDLSAQGATDRPISEGELMENIETNDRAPKIQSGKIESFEVVTLRTSGMRAVTETEMKMNGDLAEVSRYWIRFDDGNDERVLESRVLCDKEKALKLLNDCRLLSWDGFYGNHPRGILDGTVFSLDAVVNGGKKISAHGSQNFPRHYDELTDGLYRLLKEEKEVQK